METIYLDNNATTQPAPQVVEVMGQVNEELWANPSSVHRFGQAVRHRLELARQQAAALINARGRELVFTSGGTESNNLALCGVLERTVLARTPSAPRPRGVLITTKTDHAAVREPAQRLAGWGVTVVNLAVDRAGRVSPDELGDVLNEHADGTSVPLVSIHWANNETGVVQPIERLVEVCRAHSEKHDGAAVLFHSDATQAVGKITVDVKKAGVDLLSFAAHKFHGPKGVGGLYVKEGVRLSPQNRGGPQELSRRGGTENTPGVIGMGVACDLAAAFVGDDERVAALSAMRDRFETQLLAIRAGTQVNAAGCEPGDVGGPTRLWNTTNVGFRHLQAEAILLALSEQGVCASAGAACSSGSLEPSEVLTEMGVEEPLAHGSVRFSLSRNTTQEQLSQAVEIVRGVVERLAKTLPLGV